jgi:hypothetical protein
MDPEPQSFDEAAKRLIADYGLQPPRRFLENVWFLNKGMIPNPSKKAITDRKEVF